MPKTETSSDVSRRRGRPVGKNRTPLSLEERRFRNAQYERQRRNQTSDGLAQLAEAVGCEVRMSNSDLIAAALTRLQTAANLDPSEDIENLKRCNENLMEQIAELEQRLGWSEFDDKKENLGECRSDTKAKALKQRNKRRRKIKREPLTPSELKSS